jgi:hypothetical protein
MPLLGNQREGNVVDANWEKEKRVLVLNPIGKQKKNVIIEHN